jgi:hypothetical protein
MQKTETHPEQRRYPTGEQLVAEAMGVTGLSDFGPGHFRDGLQVLLDSLEHEAGLDPSTDEAVVGTLRRRLVNRLEVEAWYRDHPEIEQLSMRGPIDVCGLPRTGTTALGNMMSLDPQFRCLRGWEQTAPCPPPTLAGEAEDPRRLQAIEEYAQFSPEQKAMHIFEVDATMEDSDILGMAFHGQQFTLPVYGYQAWWRDADLTDSYHYHRRVVKLLQSRRPPDLWLFKAPHHKFHLEAVVSAYPDVRFVMTHRDPAKVVPSYSSLVSAYFPASRGELDRQRLGREVSNHLRVGMENAIAARARLGDDRFLDVHHRELVADPIGTLRRIYDFCGLELRSSFEQAVADWQQTHRSGAHGTHHREPCRAGPIRCGPWRGWERTSSLRGARTGRRRPRFRT